jgi:cerevisin
LQDERAYFSNFGKCNDIFAPGLNILSTWTGSKYAVNTISGTSMASPHIAGLLAYLLSMQPAIDSAYAVAEISPKKLKAHLLSIATKNALTNVPSDTANILAWNGGGVSNFSAIVEAGGYTVGEKSVEHSVETIKEHVSELSEEAIDMIKKVEGKLEDFLAEELKGLKFHA